MALGFTQPLTEMSTINLPWEGGRKPGRRVGQTLRHLRDADRSGRAV
jgi:hypothetical protein